MMNTSKNRWLIGIMCLSLGLPSLATGGTTGKITGMVRDAKGSALPGVNVTIGGTKRGAITDPNGYYLILSMDPGIYALTASLIGFEKQTKTEVNVRADLTSDVNFVLKEMAIEAAEVTVTAERPPVEVDKTASKYVVGATEIQEAPIVRTTQDFVALQPGANVEGAESLRASDEGTTSGVGAGDDVIYYVDGVQVTHSSKAGSRTGVGRQIFSGVSKTTVQEMTVITGGMDAEYGNAQGGVISVVTKDGQQDYHGWMEYRYTPPGKKHWGPDVYVDPIHKGKMKWGNTTWENERDPVTGRLVHQRTDYTDVAGHEIEANLSGALTSKASFMVAGSWSGLANPLPGSATRGFRTSTGAFVAARRNMNVNYGLTLRPTSNLKMKVGGMLRRYERWISQDVSYWLAPGVERNLGDSGKNIFLPSNWSASGRQTVMDDTEYLSITHTLSPKTFYEIHIARSSFVEDTIGVPGQTTDLRKDADGWFTEDRRVQQYELSEQRHYQLKADLSSQVTRGHFIKAGVDLVKSQIWTTRITGESATTRRIELSGKNGGIYMGQPAGPIVGGAYVQDKMEFQGLVVNAGMRLDFLDPSDKVPILPAASHFPMWSTYQRFKNVALKEPRILYAFSPRLGVSHPITSRSSVHFFLGRFTQWPSLYYLYCQDWMSKGNDTDWNGNGKIDENELYNSTSPSYPVRGGQGTVDFKPESTVNFELGADWNFVSDYTIGMTMFYKSSTDQLLGVGSSVLLGDKKTFAYAYSINLGEQMFEDTRGFEFSIRKRMSKNFSFSVAYNLQWHTQGRYGWFRDDFVPDSTWVSTPYNGQPRYWSDFKIENGQEVPVYLTAEQLAAAGNYLNTYLRDFLNASSQTLAGTYWYGTVSPMKVYGWNGRDAVDEEHIWDQTRAYSAGISPKNDIRSSGSFQLFYATPSDYGPNVKVLGSPILANWRVNLIYRVRTGAFFYYTPPVGQRELRQGRPRTWTDLRVEKSFPFSKGSEIVAFAEVDNLFNEMISGTTGYDYVQWGLQAPRPNDADYLKYGGNPSYMGSPRQMVFGLRMRL